MRVLPLIALVALALMPVVAAQASASLFLSPSDPTYDGVNHVWVYTYVIDNRYGPESVFDVLLEHVDDAAIKESPVGWTTNSAVYKQEINGTVGWYTDELGSYTVPVGKLSTEVLTGSFVITSPWARGTDTAAFAFNENAPSGSVDGPVTSEPRALGVLLTGSIGALMVGCKRRRRKAGSGIGALAVRRRRR